MRRMVAASEIRRDEDGGTKRGVGNEDSSGSVGVLLWLAVVRGNGLRLVLVDLYGSRVLTTYVFRSVTKDVIARFGDQWMATHERE